MINNIVRRLRDSRIDEEAQSYEYKFEVPWRLSTEYDDGSYPVYNYNPKSMDYLEEIVSKSTEDFNEIDWSEYTDRDRRTEDCGIKSMSMSFDDNYQCIITVVTRKLLNASQIDNVIDYLTGQMSDGWGEGFEQREIASDTEYDEEWVEGEDGEEGWYEPVHINVFIYCQFYWSGDHSHPYQITVASTPTSGDSSTNESLEESEDSHTLWMAKYKPVQFSPRSASGYKKVVFYAADNYSDAEEKLDTILPPYSECKLLGRAPSLQLCLDDGFELLESSNESESFPDDWSYWVMPDNHFGPFQYPHYIKNYTDDVRGYIYPPYESDIPNIDSIRGYQAELYSVQHDEIAPMKVFDTYEEAKTHLDKAAADYLSKAIDESIDLDWHRDYVKGCSIEDLRAERDDIRSKIDAAKSPESIKKWEELYDIYHDEISNRVKNESVSTDEEYNGAIIKNVNGKYEVHDKEGNKHVTVRSPEHAKYYVDKNMPYAKDDEEIKESENSVGTLSIDEDKLEAAMKAKGYYSGEFSEFLYDIYGLEDGEDYQLGNGYELLFYKDTDKQRQIDQLKSDLGDNVSESSELPAFHVIDRTDGSESYACSSEEEAREKIKDLVAAGSDEDEIEIVPVSRRNESASLEDNVVGMYMNGDSLADIAYNLDITRADAKVIIDDYLASRKDSVEEMTESSEDIDSIVNEIREKINKAVTKFMTSPRIGFPEDEVKDYTRVDVEYTKGTYTDDNYVKIEVGAELSYNALSDLCDELNPIVDAYESGAYFEPEQPGIIVSYLSVDDIQ